MQNENKINIINEGKQKVNIYFNYIIYFIYMFELIAQLPIQCVTQFNIAIFYFNTLHQLNFYILFTLNIILHTNHDSYTMDIPLSWGSNYLYLYMRNVLHTISLYACICLDQANRKYKTQLRKNHVIMSYIFVLIFDKSSLYGNHVITCHCYVFK